MIDALFKDYPTGDPTKAAMRSVRSPVVHANPAHSFKKNIVAKQRKMRMQMMTIMFCAVIVVLRDSIIIVE